MIVKGIISAIYDEEKKLSVILPEHDNITTNPLPIYGNPNMSDYAVNDFVVVFAFNDNLNDAIVLEKCKDIHSYLVENLSLGIADDGKVYIFVGGLTVGEGIEFTKKEENGAVLGVAVLGTMILGKEG